MAYKTVAEKYNIDFEEVTSMKKFKSKRTLKRQFRKSIEMQSREKDAKCFKLKMPKSSKHMKDRTGMLGRIFE